MNPVVHFEMPYDDRQRMADFYAKAFGWQTQSVGLYSSFIDTEGNRIGMLQPKGP